MQMTKTVKAAGEPCVFAARTFQPVAVGYDSRNARGRPGAFFAPPPAGRFPAGQLADVVGEMRPASTGAEVTLINS
jgi:hypothetical protein